MNARTIAQGKPAPVSPRFDRKFIEDHKLVERYLENKLPFKGARDLEQWCRSHPDYLNDLKLSERAHASLKLLEDLVSQGRAIAYLPDYLVEKLAIAPIKISGCPYHCKQTIKMITRQAKSLGWLNQLF